MMQRIEADKMQGMRTLSFYSFLSSFLLLLFSTSKLLHHATNLRFKFLRFLTSHVTKKSNLIFHNHYNSIFISAFNRNASR